MTNLTPALDTALRGVAPTVFGAITLALPDGDVNLLDGSGVLAFGGRTYVGEDATYGSLSAVENLSDGTGDSAPAFSMTLLPNGDASAAALAAPTMQGASVMMWLGAVDAATGIPIPDPYLVFLGEIDVPSLVSSDDGRRLDYDVVSVFERLFEGDESARLSDGYHQSLFPGETGLAFVTGVDQPVFWGVAGNPNSIVNFGFGNYAVYDNKVERY